jgi:tellurite resistance protein
MVIKAALYVALADGEFQEEEKEMLAKIGNDLGMTPAHIQGVVSSA